MLRGAARRRRRGRHARGAARARLGRAARPALEHRPHDGHDAAPQARRAAADRDGPRERLPRVIPNLRVRLTAIYGGIFVVFVGDPAGDLLLADGAPPRPHARCPSRPPPRSASCACSTCSRWPGATLVATALGLGASPGASSARCRPRFDARERFVANASPRAAQPADRDPHRGRRRRSSDPRRRASSELRAMGAEVIGAADEMDALLDGPDGARALRPRAAQPRVRRPGRGGRRRRAPRALRAACACGSTSSPAGVQRRAPAARAPGRRT